MQWGLRVLIGTRDQKAAETLGARLRASGVDWQQVDSAQAVRQQIVLRRFDALALDLILADQDSISLIQELRGRGLGTPIVTTTLRSSAPARPTTGAALGLPWLDTAGSRARLLFALKIALRRLPRFRPRLLLVEGDAYARDLTRHSLGDAADITTVADADAIRRAVAAAPFDLALLGEACDGCPHAALTDALAVSAPTVPVALPAAPQGHPAPALVQLLQTYAMLGYDEPLRAHA